MRDFIQRGWVDTRNAKGVRLGVWAGEALLPAKPARVASRPENYMRDWIAPILLSIVTIFLVSLLLSKARTHLTALHLWDDPEDLALAYILPTILITVLFGSNIGLLSVLISGLAAAYFIYPPEFSFAIDRPEHLVELGLFLLLSLTACKSTAILSDEKPLNRKPARRLNKRYRSRAFHRRFWSLLSDQGA
jgi:K+-sensing histidine kinase KdpD